MLPCLADRESRFLVFGWHSPAITVEQRFAANFEVSRASARKHLVVRFHPRLPRHILRQREMAHGEKGCSISHKTPTFGSLSLFPLSPPVQHPLWLD